MTESTTEDKMDQNQPPTQNNQNSIENLAELNSEIKTPMAPENAVTINPLLERVKMPGETHRLPSRGLFYTNGELSSDVIDGEIHIHPMVAQDEITLSSADKLYSGVAIVNVISRCIPQILKPELLLSQDVDFILLCLRKISYGAILSFTKQHIGCPTIKKINDEREEDMDEVLTPTHTYDVNVSNLIAATKEIDPTTLNVKFRYELDNGQIVKMNPLVFRDQVKMMQYTTTDEENFSDMTDEEKANSLMQQLVFLIASVDGITDKDMIKEWLINITPKMVRDLTNVITDLSEWGTNTQTTIKCTDCGGVMEVEIPTNPLVLFS